MFETYSDRARRTIFISLKIASQRGAAEIGMEDLLEALVCEDQGEHARVFAEEMKRGAVIPVLPKHRAFFKAEAAAAIHHVLEPLLPTEGTLPQETADRPLSTAVKGVLVSAYDLSQQLSREPDTPTHLHAGRVGLLHLLAAAMADETSEIAKIVNDAGIGREAVIAAIRSGEYSW